MKLKIANVIGKIFAWGILVTLFAGGLTAIGFLIAMIIGGGTGEAIAVFLHKKVFSVIIYSTSILVLLGLVQMYLKGEKSLVMESGKKEK